MISSYEKPLRNEIDFMNAALCLLVVFFHLCAVPLLRLRTDSTSYLFLYLASRLSSFVVPGLIFLSGLKLSKKYASLPFSYSVFLRKRIRTTYFPYLTWTLIYYLTFLITGMLTFDFGQMIRFFLDGSITAPFYLIIILMQFYLLFPLFLRLASGSHPLILNAVVFILTLLFQYLLPHFFPDFPYFDRIFPSYLIFFTAGCTAGVRFEHFRANLHKLFVPLIVLATLSGAVDCSLSYADSIGFYRSDYLEIAHLFYTVFVLFALLALAHYVLPFLRHSRILALVNRSSYHIYLSHCYILFLFGFLLMQTGLPLRTSLYFIFAGLAVYVLPLVFSILYQWLKKHRLTLKEH